MNPFAFLLPAGKHPALRRMPSPRLTAGSGSVLKPSDHIFCIILLRLQAPVYLLIFEASLNVTPLY